MQSQAPREVTSAWCMMLEPLLSATHFPPLPPLFFFFCILPFSILTPGFYLLPCLNCRPVWFTVFFLSLSPLLSLSFFLQMVGMSSPGGWGKRWAKHFSTFGPARRSRIRTTLDSRLFSYCTNTHTHTHTHTHGNFFHFFYILRSFPLQSRD